MHSYVCLRFFLGQVGIKGKLVIVMINLQSGIRYRHPRFLCAMIVADKLRVNQKTKKKKNNFFVYVQEVYMMENKQARKQKAYFINLV